MKTRKVNQDCLENFFGNTRRQGGNCINPSPKMFEKSFCKICCQNFLHSEYMNCEDDLGVLLTQINSRETSVFELNAVDKWKRNKTLNYRIVLVMCEVIY